MSTENSYARVVEMSGEPTDQLDSSVTNTRVSQTHRLYSLLIFVLAFLFAAAYMNWYSKRGWLPEDDGLFGQSALRVLHGQLPHRDFVENYTGGLSCLNAVALRLFGLDLGSLRIMAFIFFLASMAAVFYVASRMMSVVAAAAVLVLAAIWGAPNYPTPMPSWYNLYFAVFGAAALFRYLETEKRRWLIAAGCCGGFSCLIKIVGLYYVAAVLIFLVFREQSINGNEDSPRKTAVYSLFIILSTATFLVLLASMMRQRFDDREFTQFFLPPAVIVAGVIGHELRLRSRCGNAARFGTLSRMLVPFTLGVALPIAGFMVPYVRSRSAHAFVQGVFGGLSGRVQAMGLVRPEHAQALVFPLALVCVIAIVAFWERTFGPLSALAVTLTSAVLFLWSFRVADVARGIWLSASLATPCFVALGTALIFFRPSFADGVCQIRRQQVFLLVALAAICSLVRFPFDAKIYFCYFAPLLVLAAAAILKLRKRIANPGAMACLAMFYAIFAIARIAPVQIYESPLKRGPVEILNLARAGGVRIPHAELYQRAISTVVQHAGSGPIIATPECPDVYFMSGLQNPTRNDGALSSEEILTAIQDPALRVVIFNTSAQFSESTLTPDLLGLVAAEFPQATQIGKYWICWR